MNGTGDDGDSVGHYLHNRYAFEHPWLFIHTWARPFYVLASCTFAQFGFIGIKIFNSLMAIGAAYLAYRLAKKIDIPHAELVIPILMCMPDYLRFSLSGLTEPLFSFMAVSSLLLLAKDKHFWGAMVISFSPFVRPEGMYFMALAGVYFAFKENSWKYIPLLLFGHIFYTLFGVLGFGETWFWIFTKNPNAMIDPAYNQTGTWLHYVRKMRYVLGLPIWVLFWTGCVMMSIPILLKLKEFKSRLDPIFILAATASVLVTHTIFWKFGLFKSLGLTRNLLTVAPLMAIIALAGMQGLFQAFHEKAKPVLLASLLSTFCIIGFLYSNSRYTLSIPEDFQLNPLQELAIEVADYIQKEHPRTYMLYHYYPYINVVIDQDPFEWQNFKVLFKEVIDNPLPKNAIIIWDDWFSVMDGKVTLEMLNNNDEIEFVKSFKTKGEHNKERTLAVYKTKYWD